LSIEFGLDSYTEPFTARPQIDVFLVTMSLMIGTAGLPHVIIRFYTTKSVRGARYSAFWALLFIALLYSTAPAVGAFAKFNILEGVGGTAATELPDWVESWEATGLVTVSPDAETIESISNDPAAGADLTVDNDILVLANPEIAGLPAPVVGLVAAGGMAAAMSTAAGLLLVISSSASHDFYFRRIKKGHASESEKLLVGRLAMAGAVVIAVIGGINPPAFVAQVVAFAFGLGAASFFPTLVLGIFWKRCNAKGAAAGMSTGLAFTAAYMIWSLYISPGSTVFDISPEGIGTIGALVNFLVAIVVSKATAPPPEDLMELVENMRYPAATRRSISPTKDQAPNTELGGA
jgi:cation/acetate symporter